METSGTALRSPEAKPRSFSLVLLPLLTVTLLSGIAEIGRAQDPGSILFNRKVSDTRGDFGGVLDDNDQFGFSIAQIGDLDGDGITDLAVGSRFDDDEGIDRGAVWILFLRANGTVRSHTKISDSRGGFFGVLNDGDELGRSVAGLGDVDNDGVEDLAVAAYRDDDGGTDRGAVWILFLRTDGTVKALQKISDTEGDFLGFLDDDDRFGHSMTSPGDLDGDGTPDLVVTAHRDDDGGSNRGAVWMLFLSPNGTVRSHQKISDTEGGFSGSLDDDDFFGRSVAVPGDLDNDGVVELAVGAAFDDDGGSDRGAVWVLFLNSNGTVRAHQKISATTGGFSGTLDDRDLFGFSVAALDDLDGNGVEDLAVGAAEDDDGGTNRGALWILFLDPSGATISTKKISDTQGGFRGELDDSDIFGSGATSIGDLDGNGTIDLAVGAPQDDDGGPNRGGVWLLFLCDGQGSSNIASVLPNEGSELGDDQVSILGTGFTTPADTQVEFGGVPAEVISVLSDRIVVRTPPSTGTVEVTVRNCFGETSLPAAFLYADPVIAARFGNVNVGAGDREDLLLLNGSAGNAERIVDVALGEPMTLQILAPSSRSVSRYALWVWNGLSRADTLTEVPADIGRISFPPPFAGGRPRITWSLLLNKGLLGCPDLPSAQAPAQLFSTSGRFREALVTMQGIIRDDNARVPEGFSVTNGIVLRLE